MPLHSLVVHKIEKGFNELPILTLADHVLPVGDREREFVESVRDVYYKKSNPIFGVFDGNIANYPFQTMLGRYVNNEDEVLTFSVAAMNHLQVIIRPIPQATGGYVLFAHYTSQNNQFVLTVVLNDKRSFNVNDALSIVEVFSLAIDKLDVANAVNLTKWGNAERQYLSFVKGRKEVSNYFLQFIGCTTNIDAKHASEEFERAFRTYLVQQDLPPEREEQVRNDVYAYCHERITRNEDVSLNHISAIIEPNEPELFSQFAAGEEYGVSATFRGHEPTLKHLKYFSYSSNNLTIKFDRGLMNNDQIRYDPATNTLTIRNLPDRLRDKFLELEGEGQ